MFELHQGGQVQGSEVQGRAGGQVQVCSAQISRQLSQHTHKGRLPTSMPPSPHRYLRIAAPHPPYPPTLPSNYLAHIPAQAPTLPSKYLAHIPAHPTQQLPAPHTRPGAHPTQ